MRHACPPQAVEKAKVFFDCPQNAVTFVPHSGTKVLAPLAGRLPAYPFFLEASFMRSPCDLMSWQDKVNLSCRRGCTPRARCAGGTTAEKKVGPCKTLVLLTPFS